MTKTSDFLGNEWTIDCMGCAISNGSMLVPGGMIQRTKNFCVHQDPLIPLPGFLVIASIRQIIQEESSIHFHLWFFPWTESVIEQYGQPSLAKIREIMFDYRKQAIGEAEWMKLEKTIEKIKSQMCD